MASRVEDLNVATPASVGEATRREDNIKTRGQCVGLHVLAFMLISAGDRFKSEVVVSYLERPQ